MAARLGASHMAAFSSVLLTQRGTMRDRPDSRQMRFRAAQRIAIERPEFEWRASIGPFGCISVLDEMRGSEANLEVRAFGRLPIATVRGGAAAGKGEIMRYLAELVWAPDAILRNPSLSWDVVDSRRLRVSAGQGPARGAVELRLDEGGRVGSVFARDRPRKERSGFVERPWHGRFFDYRRHERRWLPFGGEVGWTLDGQSFIAWRGVVLSWHRD